MVLNGSFKDSVEVLLKKTKKKLNIAFGASEGSSRKTATVYRIASTYELTISNIFTIYFV